eukprot:1148683-Pelagomonas_calceolata.AAC.2
MSTEFQVSLKRERSISSGLEFSMLKHARKYRLDAGMLWTHVLNAMIYHRTQWLKEQVGKASVHNAQGITLHVVVHVVGAAYGAPVPRLDLMEAAVFSLLFVKAVGEMNRPVCCTWRLRRQKYATLGIESTPGIG